MHFMKASIIKFLKFTFFSLGAAIVEVLTNTLIIFLFGKTDLVVSIAVWASMVTSCTFSFNMNRKFTFKSKRNLISGLMQYIAFYTVITIIGNYYVLFLKHHGVDAYLCDPIRMVTFYVFDYSFCNLYLFRDWSKKKNKDKEISVAP